MRHKNIGDCVGRQGVSVDTTFDPLPPFPAVFGYPPAFKGGPLCLDSESGPEKA